MYSLRVPQTKINNRARIRGRPVGHLSGVSTYEGRQHVTCISGNTVFPHAKEFIRKLSAILAGDVQICANSSKAPCMGPGNDVTFTGQQGAKFLLPGQRVKFKDPTDFN